MGVGQLDKDQEEVCGLTDLLRHGLPLIDRIERKQEKRDPTNEVYFLFNSVWRDTERFCQIGEVLIGDIKKK